jgi:serine/threonine protein kinase
VLLDDRYRLGPPIGRGGMATVHAAMDIRLRRRVAVKLFHPGVDEVTLARLGAEARLLAGLSHPGLPRVFDACVTGERPYLVLELVSGATLRELINKGRLEPRLVARLGARLAGTLEYVHSRQIVHRDIKPSNVLVDGAGDGYLADFGIARTVGTARLTRTGQCVGTAAYLAPEQVSGAEIGPAADIYSLGLVLLECLTGRPEYTGTEVEAAVARLTRSPQVPTWLPPALRRTLIDMTAREPGDRPDAATCAQRFDEALAGSCAAIAPPTDLPTARTRPATAAELPPTDLSPAPTRVQPVPPVHRPAWLRAAARAAVVVALAAGVGLAMLLPSDPVGSSPPAQPAAPPAQPGNRAPAADLVPQTAVGNVVAPATDRKPATGSAKKGKKKGRQDGEKRHDRESDDG